MEAARTLSDLAEIINRLWGVDTPGGRLYPAPVRREVIVMAWNAAGTATNTALAADLPHAVDPDDQPWRCVILRAVFEPLELRADPGLQRSGSCRSPGSRRRVSEIRNHASICPSSLISS